MFQAGIASLTFQLQGPLEVNFRGEMSIFEGRKSLGMAGVSLPFLVLILGEGISFVLQLLCAHEAML